MKSAMKQVWIVVSTCLVLSMSIGSFTAFGLEISGKAALLMDSQSGRVLYEYNSTEKLPIASITKLMTLIIILEAVERGELSLADVVSTSPFAASKRGSRVWLETGEQLPLKEMLYAIAVGSANDAAVAVAEFAAGSEGEFVTLMNQKAHELGLMDTTYANSTGLPTQENETQVMTALDVAKLARYALTVPRMIEFVSTYEYTMRADSTKIPVLWNSNKLLRRYQGVDGLKTGFTTEAGYCMAATAERQDLRLIAVVLGSKTDGERESDIRALLDYGFRKYHNYSVLRKDTTAGEIICITGQPYKMDVILAEDLCVTVERGKENEIATIVEINKNVTAPIKRGAAIGSITALFEDEVLGRAPLTAAQDVEKANLLTLMLRMTHSMIEAVF